MRKALWMNLVLGFQLFSLSAHAMGSAPSNARELSKIVKAEDEGSYSVCDGGFHFFFFNNPYSKAEDNAQDRSLEKAKDKCENVMGGKFEQESTVTKRCRPLGNIFGSCGFECTAETSGKCKVMDVAQDPRVSTQPAAPQKTTAPERVTVQGRDYIFDAHGRAHLVVEDGSEQGSAESGK